jgi:hypothetical protein
MAANEALKAPTGARNFIVSRQDNFCAFLWQLRFEGISHV